MSRVIPEENWDQKHTDIVNYNVSVFAMGDEWSGQFDALKDITQVRYLPRRGSVLSPDRRADDVLSVA